MENLVVDERGASFPAPAPDGTVVGLRDLVPGPFRLVWASMSARYHPSHPSGESCLFGIDMSFVLSPGAQIVSASLAVFTNAVTPAPAPEWTVGPVVIDGMVVFAQMAGGTNGTDYQFSWQVNDSDGNIWVRRALVLCSQTS